MLRDYQIDLMDRALASQARSVCVQAPTGSGKTTVMSAMAQHHSGSTILFLAHRQEILRQLRDRLGTFGIEAGIIAPWAPRTTHKVQVASVQTLQRRELSFVPEYIFTDECHHATSNGYKSIYNAIDFKKHYGFTATPQRLDGRGLIEVYDELIVTYAPNWFIKNGYLSQYKYYAPVPSNQVDTSSLGKRGADFKMEEAAALFSGGTVHGNIFQEWEQHAKGRKTIGFACTVKHAEEIAAKFREGGVTSEVLCGTMSTPDRAAVLDRLKGGQTSVVWTVDVVSEGFDLPECEAIILARPTLSLTVFLQQVGRVLRPSPDGQPAIIIDHALNIAVHGFPCIEREWSLLGQKKKDKKNIKRTHRVCDRCGHVSHIIDHTCGNCGNEFYNPRVIKEMAATMVSVGRADDSPDVGQPKNQYYEYIKLVHHAAKKGYASGWAYHKAIEKNIPILPYKQGQGLYAKFRKQLGYTA